MVSTRHTQMTTPATRPAALVFILITVLIDVLSFGLIIPVLPKLVETFEGGDTAQAAITYGIFGTAWALMQFIFMPILGALSDRFGRRPVILLSCLGLGLDFILMALAPSLVWLFIGRVISGITASNFATAGAYIADVTPPEKRASSFGMMGAAFGIGFVVGPALGGYLGAFDPRLPFWVAAALALINTAYGFFVLPESLPRDKRTPFRWARANPVGSLRLLRTYPTLLPLAAISGLMGLAHSVYPSIAVLYMSFRYQWDTAAVGKALAVVGIASIVVQGGLVKPVVRRLGEARTLLVGLLAASVGVTLYGLAPNGLWFLIAVPIAALWGLASAAVQSLMTQTVGPEQQGQLQGANGAILAIATLLGPTLYTQSFALAIAPTSGLGVPGLPFLIAASLLGIAACVAWTRTRSVGQAPSSSDRRE
jgi:MFS transporter, DHA1 family, tetracycline resistance protein